MYKLKYIQREREKKRQWQFKPANSVIEKYYFLRIRNCKSYYIKKMHAEIVVTEWQRCYMEAMQYMKNTQQTTEPNTEI